MIIVIDVHMVMVMVIAIIILMVIVIVIVITFSSISRIESGKQLLPVGVVTRELRREFASSIT